MAPRFPDRSPFDQDRAVRVPSCRLSRLLAENAEGIAEFEARRKAAFDEERADWQRKGEFDRVTDLADADALGQHHRTARGRRSGRSAIRRKRLETARGRRRRREAGDTIAVLEAMKMECPVESPGSGTVAALYMEEKAGPPARRADARPAEARMSAPERLSVAGIAAAVHAGATTALAVAHECLERIAAYDASSPDLDRRPTPRPCSNRPPPSTRVAAGNTCRSPGVPFAVKDNIDVAGLATTAACPAFAYEPEASPRSLRALSGRRAVSGQDQLDQFATGLVGTRSPWHPAQCLQPRLCERRLQFRLVRRVATGLPFALGTDTAGSGRVPAAFNHLIGFKPTKGRWSTQGLVPACRSLDCISVFTSDTADARLVDGVVAGFGSPMPGPSPGKPPRRPPGHRRSPRSARVLRRRGIRISL
jgi:hypothetical protein